MTFLAQLAVRWSGYRVRGVYGWAHPDDLRLVTGKQGWADVLAELEREGVADAYDARPGEAAASAFVYRITQAGMDEIASVLGEPAPAVRVPGAVADQGDVYVSIGARWALDALRETPGEWMSAARVKEPSEQWNRDENRHSQFPFRWVYTSHLDELVSAGLAECQGEAERTLYRATPAGLAVTLLQWAGRDPEHPIYWDHDGSPLLVAPFRCFFHGSGN